MTRKYYLEDEETYYIIRLLEQDYNNGDETFKKGEKGQFIRNLKNTILDQMQIQRKEN